MATRFELVLHGDDPVHLRAAGEQALAEITRVEALLSAYRPTATSAASTATRPGTRCASPPRPAACCGGASTFHARATARSTSPSAPSSGCGGLPVKRRASRMRRASPTARACVGAAHVRRGRRRADRVVRAPRRRDRPRRRRPRATPSTWPSRSCARPACGRRCCTAGRAACTPSAPHPARRGLAGALARARWRGAACAMRRCPCRRHTAATFVVGWA